MSDKNRGHLPKLVISVQSIQKWEACERCKEIKRRGDRWKRVCPGPMPVKAFMAGPAA